MGSEMCIRDRNNIAGNDNIDRLRTDIAGRYEISVEQIDIREAGVSG